MQTVDGEQRRPGSPLGDDCCTAGHDSFEGPHQHLAVSIPPPGKAPETGRRARVALPVGLAALTLGGCVAVAATNPGDDGVPLCWSRSVFGVDCPFCGGLRATNSLLRGDMGAALDHNVVLAVAMPIAVLMWIWWTWNAWRGNEISAPQRSRTPLWISIAATIALVAFGVIRNFTGAGWMRWLHSDTFVG
ncbi:MAG: DUF2752 domain-containing protein [Microthrixaceae bacterium]